MNRGRVTEALVDVAMLAAGRLRGGLGHVTVLTSVFFSGISGAAMADAAALSSTLVPQMRERGFPDTYSAALVAAASIIGPIIPPSIIMIFYGAIMGVDVAALFAGGIVPGALLAAALMVSNAVAARVLDLPRGTAQPRSAIVPTIRHGLPALMLPVVILGGIVLGWMTPTEAAAVAALAALLTGFHYRSLDLVHLRESLVSTVKLSGAIFMAIAMGGTLAYVAVLGGVPDMLTQFVAKTQVSQTGYLLTLTGAMFVVGMFMESAVALALIVPILAPIAIAQGVDPVHLGVAICFNLSLGLLAPPFGGSLLVTSAATQVPFGRLARAALPFLAIEFGVLLTITFIPALTLWLPEKLGLL